MFGWTNSRDHTISCNSLHFKIAKAIISRRPNADTSEQSDSGPKFCAKSEYEVEVLIPVAYPD